MAFPACTYDSTTTNLSIVAGNTSLATHRTALVNAINEIRVQLSGNGYNRNIGTVSSPTTTDIRAATITSIRAMLALSDNRTVCTCNYVCSCDNNCVCNSQYNNNYTT